MAERKPVALGPDGYYREIGGADYVNVQDAAEQPLLLSVPFTVSAAGDNTLVTPSSNAKAVRLRRLLPTLADPDGSSTPLLSLKIGTTEIARGYVLSGRFSIAGATGAPIVLNLSKNGSVSGTVLYEEFTP